MGQFSSLSVSLVNVVVLCYFWASFREADICLDQRSRMYVVKHGGTLLMNGREVMRLAVTCACGFI